MDNFCKIFLTYNTEHRIIKTDILQPIQTGRALSKKKFKQMIGDDTGENISELNPYFCELTAMYWCWKNYQQIGTPKYIGFMHYRRHLSFKDKEFEEDEFGLIREKYYNKTYLEKYGLTDKNIKGVITGYDIVVAKKFDVRKLKFKNCYDHYKKSSAKLHIEDYDKIIKYIKDNYSEYSVDIDKYNKNYFGYFTNIFIMKKELFFDFMKWYFDILLNTYKTTVKDRYSKQELRQIGYISEFVFGIYLTHLKRTKKIKIKELQRTFIEDMDTEEQIEPLRSDAVTVCLASDENYAPFLATALASIINHTNKDKYYDFVILSSNISPHTKERLIKSYSDDNISIRFFNIDLYIDNCNSEYLKEIAHFTKAIYYRIFIPKIFSKYKKVCYLDTDCILNTDISQLYDIDIKTHLAGVCLDMEAIRMFYSETFWRNYFLKKIGIKNNKEYFNSGVILFNIPKCLNYGITEKALEILKQKPDLLFPDQDALNIILKNKVLFIDGKWNMEYHIPLFHADFETQMPAKDCIKYKEQRQSPYIIHYTGGKKPWNNPEVEFADIWWSYARKTPFYEEILKRLRSYNNTDSITPAVLTDIIHYKRNILKYWKYKFLRNLTFGETKNRYKFKKNFYKEKIRSVRGYFK